MLAYIVETTDNTDYRGRRLKVEIVTDTKIKGDRTERKENGEGRGDRRERGDSDERNVRGKSEEFRRKNGKKNSHGKDSRKPSRKERRRR